MSQRHYDIAILGESLAARVAAALLVRRGKRVIFFREPIPAPTQWLFSSFHLRQLLQNLGGRSCAISPQPLQVLTSEARWEINGKNSLDEELRREFPGQDQALGMLLHRLSILGERLEMALWKSRGKALTGGMLPGNLFFKGLTSALKKPLSSLLKNGDISGSAAHALETLFIGISRLSVAEGALLWSWVVSSEGVSPSGLEELLRYRLEQFNGESIALTEIKDIHAEGKKIKDIVLKTGARCSADVFLLGSPSGWRVLPESFPRKPEKGIEGTFLTPPLTKEKISPMLARRILLGQGLPLRLEFSGSDTPTCRIEVIPSPQEAPFNAEEVKKQLDGILPFATFTVDQQPNSAGERFTGCHPFFAHPFKGMLNPIRLRGNLMLAQGSGVWPSLGPSGEILIGYSVANWLDKGQKKRL